VGSENLEQFGAPELKDFLTELAVKGEVAASTQNHALSGVMFFYQRIKGRELEFIDAVKAKRPQHLPLVLSRGFLVESQVLGSWLGGNLKAGSGKREAGILLIGILTNLAASRGEGIVLGWKLIGRASGS
jgi:hypothetical protein